MHELTLPKLNNNDDTYTITQWCFADGDWVPADAVVAVVETSKIAEDLVSPAAGYLQQVAAAGAEWPVGGVIGYLRPEPHQQPVPGPPQPATGPAAGAVAGSDAGGGPTITAPARELMRRHGVSEEQVRTLGRQVIKSADIMQLAQAAAAGEPEPVGSVIQLPARQRAVAAMVTRSHASIPAAYAAVDIVAAATPAQVVKALGELRERFPQFFGAYQDGGTVRVPPGVSVAVTIDAGHGLFMPVLREVAARTLAEITAELEAFRTRAAGGGFRAEELTGGNIGLSLHTYRGVVAAQPLVFPGHSCMLSLCAPRNEVWIDGTGAVGQRKVFQLGLAYDHRVVNGRDAVMFLRAMKSIIERHDRRVAAAG